MYPSNKKENKSTLFHFIPSGEFSAYLKQLKGILCTVKKYRIFFTSY